jgi:tetratricopeptide (TPR) repeat protein
MIFSILLIIINVKSPVKEKYHKALKMKDPLAAGEYYRQVINEAPNTPYEDSSLFRIGMLYYILGDFDKTIDHFELIYKRGKKSTLYSKTCYWLNLCYENVGNTDKAAAIKRKNKNLFPQGSEQKSTQKKKDVPEEKNVKAEKTIREIKQVKEEKKEEGFYSIQLGAYEDEKWLEYFLEKLNENNVEYFLKKAGRYTKIFSGKFDTRIGAEKYLEEIKNKGFHGFITFDSNP